MIDYIDDNEIPVFIINGFLEAGKTSFIQYTMGEEYFRIDGNTLLIVCEEGEVSYQKEELASARTRLVQIDDESELDPDRMEELRKSFDAERVIIEYNGMWDPTRLRFPEGWVLYQQITIFDGSTLTSYLNNMKALMGPMLRNTELVIVNRCDGIPEEQLGSYRRTLKAMGRQADIVFETSEGEVEPEITEEDLPYDMKADVVKIAPEYYGIWYIDCMDKPERYVGKVVEFTAMAMKSPEFPKNYFVPGRMAMTCCEADMAFLGFICKAREARLLETGNWLTVRARIALEYWKDYGGEGPVLYAESVEPAEEIKDIVQF